MTLNNKICRNGQRYLLFEIDAEMPVASHLTHVSGAAAVRSVLSAVLESRHHRGRLTGRGAGSPSPRATERGFAHKA